MPTIRAGAPSIGTVRPTIDSSPPNALRHNSLESTATSSAPGSVSSRVNCRPRIGATPSAGISSEVMTADVTRRGWSGVPRLTRASAIGADLRERSELLSANSMNSGAETQN